MIREEKPFLAGKICFLRKYTFERRPTSAAITTIFLVTTVHRDQILRPKKPGLGMTPFCRPERNACHPEERSEDLVLFVVLSSVRTWFPVILSESEESRLCFSSQKPTPDSSAMNPASE